MTLHQGSLAHPAQPQFPSIPKERAEQKAMSTLQQKAGHQVTGVKEHEPKGPAFPRAELRAPCKEWWGAPRAGCLAAGALVLAKYDKYST